MPHPTDIQTPPRSAPHSADIAEVPLATQPRRYLVGIQGLRTVAALLVAVYHIWFGRVSGGVDVFFVVAGFFAVGSLTRLFGAADSAHSAARGYWFYLLRTLRRIVPSMVVVIVGTVVASILWMPRVSWANNIQHAWATLTFSENWHLIATSTDYVQEGLEASIFQQFWALAVNAQFYLLFATLLFVLALIAARLPAARRAHAWPKMVLGVIAITFAVSFIYSVVSTATNQPAAYFDTFARLWEFMVGSAAFVLLPYLKIPRIAASILGWGGLALLLSLGAVADLSLLLPGYLSLIPVAAAVALIVSSWASAEPVVLRWRPVLLIADASFALYLWHWPLLVLYRYRYGQDVPFWAGVLIIVASILLALVTTKLVETPLRNSALLKRSSLATLAAMGLLLAGGAASIWGWSQPLREARATTSTSTQQSGGGLSTEMNGPRPPIDNKNALRPALTIARDDYTPLAGENCNVQYQDPNVRGCEWGNPDSTTTVALVGGSHSLQWFPAVLQAVEATDSKLWTYNKNRCVFGDVDGVDQELDPSCKEWNEELLALLLADPPDVVVSIGTRFLNEKETIPEGYRTYFEALSEAGVSVVAVRAAPLLGFDAPACADTQPFDTCFVLREERFVPLEELGVPEWPGFTFVDMVDAYCNEEVCPVVDGDIMMYRDKAHLTNTWIMERGGAVTKAVEAAILARPTQ